MILTIKRPGFSVPVGKGLGLEIRAICVPGGFLLLLSFEDRCCCLRSCLLDAFSSCAAMGMSAAASGMLCFGSLAFVLREFDVEFLKI